ncbi:MAG: polymer-forming cytoskeletal protein [Gammaproteobacteria bacterium]|nr:polymer-forming cytoskeletal protein [Gammaproteobacteria bacterium]
MALWKDSNPMPQDSPVREADKTNVAALNPEPVTRRAPPSAPAPAPRAEAKESLIAPGVTIEGKIEGTGHVRLAGRFKGDVSVDGNLTIETGAQLTGLVRASVVVVAGHLQGNIENARRVELLEGGVIDGDVKAGSLTVAAGSKMRGKVEFGWEEKGGKPAVDARGLGTGT